MTMKVHHDSFWIEEVELQELFDPKTGTEPDCLSASSLLLLPCCRLPLELSCQLLRKLCCKLKNSKRLVSDQQQRVFPNQRWAERSSVACNPHAYFVEVSASSRNLEFENSSSGTSSPFQNRTREMTRIFVDAFDRFSS